MNMPFGRTKNNMFHTERLTFRHYTPADSAALFQVFNHPDTYRFYPQMADINNVKKWIQWNLENYEAYDIGLWALEYRETGQFIGDCGLTYQDVDGEPQLEIGYHIHPDFQGKGLATEAAKAVIHYAIDQIQAPFVCSIVDPLNIASQKVAKKIHSSERDCIFDGKTMNLYYTESKGQ